MAKALDFRSSIPFKKESYKLRVPVFFVGFMGAGKTSVSRKLARIAGIAALDMDTYIERQAAAKVKDIFKECGEEGFRTLETSVLEELAAQEPQLISCGGGVVKSAKNREILKSPELSVVYLKVSAKEAASRISDLSTRPLFGDLAQATKIMEERLPLYEEVADITFDTSGKSASTIAKELKEILLKEDILWQ